MKVEGLPRDDNEKEHPGGVGIGDLRHLRFAVFSLFPSV